MPKQTAIPAADVLRNHRELMLHSVLAHGPEYRKALREACREYDALLLREKANRPTGRPKKLPSIGVGKHHKRSRAA